MADLKLSILMEARDKLTANFQKARTATGNLRTSLDGTAKKLHDLESAAKKLTAYRKLRADSKATATELAAAKEKAASLGKALADGSSTTKRAQQEFDRARRTVRRLQEVYEDQTASADKLRRSMTSAGIITERAEGKTGGLANAEQRLRRDLDATRAAMNRQAEAAKRLSAARDKMKASMKTAEKTALAGAGAAGVAYGAKSLLDVIIAPTERLEAARGDIASLGMNDKEQQTVLNKARETARQIAGVTADGFVAASYDIKSGISSLSAEGVASMTRAAAVTAKATKSNIATMTNLFATGYGTFKRQFVGMNDQAFGNMFASSIAKAVQMFKTTGDGMQQAISSAGSMATNLGMSMADQFTVLGMLQQTMEAGEAGTSLKSFSENAAKAQTAFDKLGNGVQIITKDGKLRGMADIMKSLKAAYGDTLDANEAQQIQQAFGTSEGMKVISNLWSTADAFRQNSAAMDQAGKSGMGVADAMAKAAQANYADQLKLMHQNFDELRLTIGNALLPVLNKLITALKPLITSFADWIGKHKSLASGIGIAVLAIGGLAAVMAPLLLAVSAIIGPFAVLRFGLSAIGIKAGGAGLKFGGLGKAFGRVSRFAKDLAPALKGGIGKALTHMGGAFGTATKAARMMFPVLRTGIISVGRALLTTPIGLAIAGIAVAAFLVIRYWKPIKAFFVNLWAGITSAFGKAWKFITDKLSVLKGPLAWLSRQMHAVFGDGQNGTGGKPHAKIAKTAAAAVVAAGTAVAPAGAHPVVQHIHSGGNVIHVHAAPGQSPQDIGREITRQLNAREAKSRRTASARLYDSED